MQAFRRVLLAGATKAENAKCGVDCACATTTVPFLSQNLRCLEARLAQVPAEWKHFVARTRRLDFTMGEIKDWWWRSGLYVIGAFLVGRIIGQLDIKNSVRPGAEKDFLKEFKISNGFASKSSGH